MTVLLSEGRVTFVIVKNKWETSYARETAGGITHASLTTIVGERDPLAHSNNHNPSQESSSSSSNLPYGSINNVTINDASLPVSITKQRSRPTTKPSFLRIIPQALGSLPPVTLGLMMNILDGVSYGLIMFPSSGGTSGGPFKDFGGIDVSMFFVTCIISQLVYSLGGSSFSGATGSMMIESVPFMHVIANKITKIIGPELPERIIATTMVAFALSSIFTGFAFFLLGSLRMGKLLGFGIMVGIVLAYLLFVVTSSQHCAIRSVMDGRTAISTVRRHPTQHTFLKKAGTRTVGLWSGNEVVGIKVFEFLNEALEHCENELLKSLYFEDSQNAPITLYSLSYESEQF
ncbi:hypothetical protein BY996DRAFT_8683725 [Phakopsora pachyrhizi]|nr:hypothetical protein BY996DRAFT_8683725 [Phakopsora pachyrhizi]